MYSLIDNDSQIQNQVIAPAALPAQILAGYVPGSSFFFASPRRTLLARGTFATVSHPGGPEALSRLPERVAAALFEARHADHDIPIAVGAIPFHASSPAQLVVPLTLQRAGSLELEALAPRAPTPRFSIQFVPEPAVYCRAVEQALKLMRSGPLRKVVLSRSLLLQASSPIDLRPLLRNLALRNPSGYTFAVDLPPAAEDAPPRTLIGASPELLVSRSGLRVLAHPLAGSVPRSADPREDQARAAALLASPKDLLEHSVVVEAVAAALRPFCSSLHVPATPSLVSTPTLWHLGTSIHGVLADPSVSSLALALALHPTPAVCGQPPELAHDAIASLEPFQRGFFAGAVGWCDANGDGLWAVSIRCAEVMGTSLRLFAGAGIVPGSSPEAELAETDAKLRTLLLALGLEVSK